MSVKDVQAVANNLTLDDAQTIAFARELESIKSKTYDIQYPELKADQFIPISHETPAGAETVTYTSYDEVGTAKLIASYADDLPLADVSGQQFSATIKGIGVAYAYSNQEVRAAAMMGKPLAQKKADAARHAHARKRDDLLATGDATAALKGFTNHSAVPITGLPAGVGGSTWALKTADEILTDLFLLVSTPLTVSKGIEFVDTVILPLSSYVQAQNKKFSPEGKTVLEQFKSTHPEVSVFHWYKLETAGASSVKRMIGYRKSSDKLEAEVPMEFTQNAPQVDGLMVKIPCESRIGGVVFYYPLSANYMDGM